MLNISHFQQIFQVSSTPALLLFADPPKFTITEVNQAFLKATHSNRDDLLFKGIFEAFPDHPGHTYTNGLLNLRESLMEVMKSRLSHKMPAQRYDIPNKETPAFEQRYWEAENIPLFDDNGEIAYIMNTVTDITKDVLAQRSQLPLNTAVSDRGLGLGNLEKASQTGSWELIIATGQVYWSDEFFRICGYEPQSFIPTIEKALEITHPDDRELTKAAYDEASDKGQEYRLEKRVVRPNGEIIYILSTGKLIRDAEGKIIKVAGLFQDITKQKEEERRLKLLESVITNTKDAVLITEAEPFSEPGPRIVYVNEAFTAMTGYTAEEVIGKTPRILQGPGSDKAALKQLSESLRQWQPCEITIINYKKSGEPFWINFSVSPVANEKGRFTHWIAIERDVSEQKLAEEKIIHANRLYAFTSRINQAIIHAGDEHSLLNEVCRIAVDEGKFKMAWIGKADTDIGKINLVAGCGMNQEDIGLLTDYTYDKGGPIEKVLSGSAYCVVADIEYDQMISLKQYVKQRVIRSGISLAVKKLGKVIGAFTIYSNEKNIFNTVEIALLLEVTANISFALDIFEKDKLRTEAEQNLRKSEQRLLEAQAVAKMGSWETELPGLKVHWSEETYRIFETSVDLFSQSHGGFLEFIPVEERQKVDAAFLNSLDSTIPHAIEHRIITAKGEEKFVIERWQVVQDALGQPVRAIGTCRDITEDKMAELKLRQSEFRYRQIVDTAQEGIWLIDENNKTTFVNKKMALILEYSPDEMIGKEISYFMNDVEREFANLALGRRREGIIENLERSYITKSGREIRTSISASPFYDDAGQYKGSLGMISDITERKAAEEKLQELNRNIEESEKRYSNLFQGSPQPMWVFDPQTFKFQQVNKAAIAHYGYSEDEFLQMTVMDIRPGEEIEAVREIITKNQAKKQAPYSGRFRHRKKSGEIIIVEIYSSSVMINEKMYRSVIAIDVTENVNLEDKITNAIIKAQEDERYEIGIELHDNVCQILATSLLNLGMLKDSVPSLSTDHWYNQCKAYIVLASDEIRNLSHQLAPAFFDEMTLEDTFWKLLNTFNVGDKYGIYVHFDRSAKEYPLNRDIQLNLFRILQEQLRNISKHANASAIEINLVIHNNNLVMRVADDGVGFDQHTVKRGIGLANIKRRAELFSGKFEIISSPGKGCEVVLEIPLEKL